MTIRRAVLVTVASMAVAAGGCGSDAKDYDISAIFPLSTDKCARYGGDQEGSGITATCMVTKAQCEKAAADWRQVMQDRGVNNAIEFTCE